MILQKKNRYLHKAAFSFISHQHKITYTNKSASAERAFTVSWTQVL